jgi:hypothetical protein
MLLAGEDPFATHLLIQSADKLLIDLAKRSPTKHLAMDWTKFMKPEYKDALIEVFRETYNFLKHANKDHDQTLHVGDIAISNVLQLGACIVNYQALFGELTDHMRVSFAIARLVFPDGFVDDGTRPSFDDAVAGLSDYTLGEFISGLRATGLAATAFPNLAAERAEDLQDVTPFFNQPFAKMSHLSEDQRPNRSA